MTVTNRTVVTIRVLYKSGYTHDFDVYASSFEGTRYKWDELGGTDIIAIWQVGIRKEER